MHQPTMKKYLFLMMALISLNIAYPQHDAKVIRVIDRDTFITSLSKKVLCIKTDKRIENTSKICILSLENVSC